MSARQELQARIKALAQRHPPMPPASAEVPTRSVLRHPVAIDGELLQDARVRTDRSHGATLLIALIKQPLTTVPLLAVRHYDGSNASVTAAHSKATRLRAGTAVKVTGEGLRVTQHRGQPAIEVVLVHSIDPPPEPITRKDFE